MPKGGAANMMLRQWTMLKHIPRNITGITVNQLKRILQDEGYNEHRRTIERDLNDLSGIFPLTCECKGRTNHWFWMEGRSLELPGMSISDALSMRMLESYLTPLMPASVLSSLAPRFKHAKELLNRMSQDNPLASWSNKVRSVQPTLTMLPPKIDADIMQSVQNALLEEKQIEVLYHAAHKEEPGTQRLHPHAIVQRGLVMYLVASPFEYTDVKIYAMHRIKSVTLTEEKIKRVADFDIDDYIKRGNFDFSQGKQIKLKAWVSEGLRKILVETPLSTDMHMVETEDGYELTATVYDSWQLYWWIQSQADEIMVYGPVKLKRTIAANLMAAAEYYLLRENE